MSRLTIRIEEQRTVSVIQGAMTTGIRAQPLKSGDAVDAAGR